MADTIKDAFVSLPGTVTKEVRKNAYIYCKLRDEQFALYDEYAKRHGMLMKTLLVVNVLYYSKDGMTQTDICRKTFQSKQTVNLIIRNLLGGEYVTLTEQEKNRRSKTVCMTESGRAFFGDAIRHITRSEDKAMSMLTPSEQEQLLSLSKKFTGHLAELIKQEAKEE